MKSVFLGSAVNEGPPRMLNRLIYRSQIGVERQAYAPIKKDIRSDDHVDEDHEAARLLGCG